MPYYPKLLWTVGNFSAYLDCEYDEYHGMAGYEVFIVKMNGFHLFTLQGQNCKAELNSVEKELIKLTNENPNIRKHD